jgi:hypothetical protein
VHVELFGDKTKGVRLDGVASVLPNPNLFVAMNERSFSRSITFWNGSANPASMCQLRRRGF